MVSLKKEVFQTSKSRSFLLSLLLTLTPLGNQGTVAVALWNESCATVTTSYGQKVELFKNGILNQDDYETMRQGKMTNADFEVAKFPGKWCILEVCGFTSDGYRNIGECVHYIGGTTRTSEVDYDKYFDLTSMSCSCSNNTRKNCKKDTCASRNPSWPSTQCAILYQETDCQSCVFDPIILMHRVEFPSLNSFQIKTAIVRPGCQITKMTKGWMYVDSEPFPLHYEGIVNDTKMEPAYHKDSENFTCRCDNSVTIDMAAAETLLVEDIPPEGKSKENNPNDSKVEVEMTNVLQYLIPILAVLLIITGGFVGFKLLRFWKHWKSSKEVKAQESTLTEKRSAIQNTTNDNEIVEMTDLSVPENIDQQIRVDAITEQLKKYVERLFESSRQKEEELYVPSVSRTGGIVVTNDLNIATDQFRLICEPQFMIKRDEFGIVEEFGRGQFGIVYKGVLKRSEDDKVQNVAIKRMKSSGVQEKVLNSFLREVKIFQYVAISHENIVRFYGACYHNGEFYILTKLCENGSLEHYLMNVMRDKILGLRGSDEDLEETCGYLIINSDETETESDTSSPALQPTELEQLLRWSEQIANGMEYLHLMKIIHLDLAVRNVLLSNDLTAKIADLGLSRKCTDGKDYARSLLEGLFPQNSFAPECISKNLENAMRMTVFVDVWAFGCTVWEIFTLGDKPYPNMTIVGVAEFLQNGSRLAQPPLAPTYVYEKLLECWKEVPQQRPTFLALRKFFEEKRIQEEESTLDLNYLKILIQDP